MKDFLYLIYKMIQTMRISSLIKMFALNKMSIANYTIKIINAFNVLIIINLILYTMTMMKKQQQYVPQHLRVLANNMTLIITAYNVNKAILQK